MEPEPRPSLRSCAVPVSDGLERQAVEAGVRLCAALEDLDDPGREDEGVALDRARHGEVLGRPIARRERGESENPPKFDQPL
jgi:hypothetical protein